jgi:DNA mismatch endonuclease, patch repair protein
MKRISRSTRSRMMAAVKGTDTQPELEIRKRLHALGFRYRLHHQGLPGKPDLVFPKYRAVVFVHGCFWHYHQCNRSTIPKTRTSWWCKKLKGNRKRDLSVIHSLLEKQWRVLVLWECSFKNLPQKERQKALDKLARQAAKFLRSSKHFLEIGAPLQGVSYDLNSKRKST